jgi:hypothetical protein
MDEPTLRIELQNLKAKVAEMEEGRRVDRVSQSRVGLPLTSRRTRLLLFCAVLVIPAAVYASNGGPPE